MRVRIMFNKLSLVVAASLTFAVLGSAAGCNSNKPIITPPPNGPARGTADIRGTVTEGAGGRITAASGSAFAGQTVRLIYVADGKLAGTDTTDAQGNWEFSGVAADQSYLFKLAFAANRDLNGNGLNDQVELTLPLNPADQSTLVLTQSIGLSDTNNDGVPDAIRFENLINDDTAGIRNRNTEHRFLEGETRLDADHSGVYDSNEAYDDSNCDGIRDETGVGGGGDSNFRQREVRGTVTAISAGSVTVSDTTYTISDATIFLGRANQSLTATSFSVDTTVKIEGFSSGSGSWIAVKLKLEDDITGDDGGALGDEITKNGNIENLTVTAITVGGVSFTINANTAWRIGDDRNASPSQFGISTMRVEVTGDGDGHGGWIARRIKSEE